MSNKRSLEVLFSFTLLAIIFRPSLLTAQSYECRRTETPIVVDGVLDEPVWKSADWVVLRKNDDGTPANSQGRFSILWDLQYLYLAYDFVDQNILATIETRDARLWTQDVAEIFMAPLQSEKVYYEFQFSPRNNWRDVVVIHRGIEHRIDPLSEWEASVRLQTSIRGTLENNQDQDHGWIAEVAIPFEDLWLAPRIPPMAGDKWRMNVFRIDYGMETTELTAWNPTHGPSFHIPSKFGMLIFGDSVISGVKK